MQSVIVYIIIAAALIYIGRRAYKALTHKHSEGCEHCSRDNIKSGKKTVTGK